MPSRLSTALVHTSLFGLVAVASKVITLTLCDGLHATGLDIGEELLFGLLFGALAAWAPRTSRWLVSAITLLYAAEAHYAKVFTSFLRLSHLQFAGDEPGIVVEGWVDGLEGWSSGLFLALVILPHAVHGPLTRALDRWLSPPERVGRRRATAVVPVAIVIGAVASLYQGITMKQGSLAHHPVVWFGWTVVTDTNKAIDLRGPAWFSTRAVADQGWTRPPKVSPRPAKAPKLNVILVLLESTGTVSANRRDGATMPWLDELARHGVRYTRAYAQTPLSIKTLFSAYSGHFEGADFEKITETRPKIPVLTLPEFAKREGMKTAFLHGAKFSFSNKLAFFGHRDWDLIEDARSVPNPRRFTVGGWGIDDRAVYDRAAKWIEDQEEPYFLGMVPITPHWPYELPTDLPWAWPNKREIDRYQNGVKIADANLGRLIEAVKRAGQWENTLWVVVGDHGEGFSQHRGNKGHSAEIYEENVRVPMVIANPALFPNAQIDDQIVQHSDILPTVIDLAGWDARGFRGDGSSLFRPREKRAAWHYTGLRGDVLGLHDGSIKCLWRPEADKIELYDLSKDPGERTNIAKYRPDEVARCKALTWAWQGYTIYKRQTLEAYDGVDLLTLPLTSATPQAAISIGGSLLGPTVELPERGISLGPGAEVSWAVGRWSQATLSMTPTLDAPEGATGEVRIEVFVDEQPVAERIVDESNSGETMTVPISGKVLQIRASGSGPGAALLTPELLVP